jgi:hypothetical protein
MIGGEDYLLQVAVPDAHFHVSMAYAILRHNGVDIGKRDFRGPIGPNLSFRHTQVSASPHNRTSDALTSQCVWGR